jgi:DnaK suppressor protein
MSTLQRRLEDELVGCLRRIDTAETENALRSVNGMAADPVDEIQATGIQRNQAAVASRVVARVAAIRAALDRMADGSYGVCVQCGEPIGPMRLRAMPEVATCVDCQARIEQQAPRGRVA